MFQKILYILILNIKTVSKIRTLYKYLNTNTQIFFSKITIRALYQYIYTYDEHII